MALTHLQAQMEQLVEANMEAVQVFPNCTL